MRYGAIVIKYNPSTIDVCWQLRRDLRLQCVQLLVVDVCIDLLARFEDLSVYYFLGIPLYIVQNVFGDRILLLRSNEYPLQLDTWSFDASHYDIVPSSHHPLQFGSKRFPTVTG